MHSHQVIELFAGHDPSGKPFVEKLHVTVDEQASATLVKSPAFIKGLARGDRIKLNPQNHQFELQQRSGNLCIRVFSKVDLQPIEEAITAELCKLGGDLDIASPRMLVYSIHVSCGFNAIESIFERFVRPPESTWIYGNVYDPDDGHTPLNWWFDILQPE